MIVAVHLPNAAKMKTAWKDAVESARMAVASIHPLTDALLMRNAKLDSIVVNAETALKKTIRKGEKAAKAERQPQKKNIVLQQVEHGLPMHVETMYAG